MSIKLVEENGKLETINHNNVKGKLREGTFVPQCCLECSNLDSDYDEYSHRSYYYCIKNVWFPVKKGTCAWQKPHEQRLQGRY